MSMIQVNGMEASRRIQCLDFLRGFFVFLALWQHFAYYINFWYVDYYDGWSFWGPILEAHKEMVGKQIPADAVSTWAAWFFTPWVSQVYLFLAAFNLAKRNPDQIKESLTSKLAVFGMLFSIFTLENFLVAPNIGEAFSLYPLQTWMLILALILAVYAWLGERGVWFLALMGMVRLWMPLEELYAMIEFHMRHHLHDNFEIDAKPDYFLTSASLGFLLGRSWWQRKTQQLKYWLGVGLVFWLLWLAFGESFSVLSEDVFATEHDLARSFIGCLGIHGIELFVVSGFLLLNVYKFDINIGLFNWIGRYSLLVFLLHRVVFLKIIMPLRMLIVNITGRELNGFFIEFWIYILLIVALAWMIKKTSVLRFLEGRK